MHIYLKCSVILSFKLLYPFVAAPGLLLIVSSHRIDYVQLTESGLQTPSSLVDVRTNLLKFMNDEISGTYVSSGEFSYVLYTIVQ